MTEIFTTSFGRDIVLKREFEALFSENDRRGDTTAPSGAEMMSFSGFCKDVFEHGMMLDFLASLGAPTRWGAALDIGGAEGAMARLLKAEARAERSDVVEAVDFSRNLSSQHFSELLGNFTREVDEGRGGELLGSRWGYDTQGYFGYYVSEGGHFWDVRQRGDCDVDTYLVRSVYDIDGSYDFITAHLALDYFDVDRLYSKVSSLLVKGGVFYVLIPYWWWIVNTVVMVRDIPLGRMPFACQRLTREDLRRFLETHHPDSAARVMERYDYFHRGTGHPVVDDYVEKARKAGLAVLGTRRLLNGHFNTTLTPRKLDQVDPTLFEDVLADIHQFRPDVHSLDLQTTFVMAAFIKEA